MEQLNCPICNNPITLPVPNFCSYCRWKLFKDPTFNPFFHKPPVDISEDYRINIKKERKKWKEKVRIEQEKLKREDKKRKAEEEYIETKVETLRIAWRRKKLSDMIIEDEKDRQADKFFTLGLEENQQSNYEDGIKYFDRALEIEPSHIYAWYNRGNASFFTGDFKEAIKSYDKAIKIEGDFIYAWHKKGNTLRDQCEYEEAIKCYDRILEINPEFQWAWYNKGLTLYDMGKYEEAIENYDRALAIDQKFIWSWNSKGFTLYRIGKYNEAIDCYNKALELDPEFQWAWNNKGNVLRHHGKNKEALKCYDKALEIDKEFLLPLNNKGVILFDEHKYNEAILCYDKVLEIDPEYKWAWFNRGLALNDRGDIEKAIESYNKALGIDEEYTDAWNALGESFYELRKINQAIDCYEKALELDPGYKWAWYNKGIALFYQAYFNEALQCYEKVLIMDPSFADAWHGKGRILYNQGNYDDAINCYDKALEIDPKHKWAIHNRGIALYEKDKYKKTARYYIHNNNAFEIIFLITVLIMGIVSLIIEMPPSIINLWFWVNAGSSIFLLIISLYIIHPYGFPSLWIIYLLNLFLRFISYLAALRITLSPVFPEKLEAFSFITNFGKLMTDGNYVFIIFMFLLIIFTDIIIIKRINNNTSLICEKLCPIDLFGTSVRCYIPIEPDLNAGLIDPDTAKERRNIITSRADFFGYADGQGRLLKLEILISFLLIIIAIVIKSAGEWFYHGIAISQAFIFYSNFYIPLAFINTLSAFLSLNALGMLMTGAVAGEVENSALMEVTLRPKTMFHISEVMFVIYELIVFKFLNLPSFPFIFLFIICNIIGWSLRKHQADITHTRREVRISFIIYSILLITYLFNLFRGH